MNWRSDFIPGGNLAFAIELELHNNGRRLEIPFERAWPFEPAILRFTIV